MIKYELIKVVKSPIFIILLLFFVALNGLIIFDHKNERKNLPVLQNIVEQYGTKIDDEALAGMKKEIDHEMVWVNELNPKSGKQYQFPYEFIKGHEAFLYQHLTDRELNRLFNLNLFTQYYETAKSVDDIYSELDATEFARQQIKKYGLSGEAEETVLNQANLLEKRLQQLVKNGEHRHFFYLGSVYEMHSLLFKKLGRAIAFEGMILVVLITALLTNYEFEHRTFFVAFTSKRGRNLLWDKLAASVIANVCAVMLLIAVTLIIYFSVYDYSNLLFVPISSYFNSETPFPYISWWNLSFLQYVCLFVGCLLLSQLLYMLLTFSLSIWLKNSYLVFFTFALFAGVSLWLPSVVSLNSNFILIMHVNPFYLIMNPHVWFMGNNIFTMFPYFEAVTIAAWAVIFILLGFFSMYKFKRQPLN
ncbi:hypothetical protein P4S80_16275 [Aeribacillus composti]|uniref:hypothetical protein n=1 Tax=Aeribacillus composti TaxID=1868734 RepID=UPI002E223943|nr:hypothetical protein [Aeribacillus composti]MED0747420.1 hypothetical protein [Aeribacillus composti]